MPDHSLPIKTSEAILAVTSVPATVQFYREILGFTGDWLWGDPPTFGAVTCGHVQVMFCQQKELAARVEGHQHFFRCEDVKDFHHQHLAAGANIISPLENKPWGISEYTVRDINGYHLRFAGPADFKKPANALDSLPNNVRIVERLPTVEEYITLLKSVGWNAVIEPATTALSNSLFGVVAIETTGTQEKTIGSIRVIGDRAKFFYLQDVMVMPEHQNQRVGAAMMETTMNWLKHNAPQAANVGLFTGKFPFYERYGFTRDSGGMTMRL